MKKYKRKRNIKEFKVGDLLSLIDETEVKSMSAPFNSLCVVIKESHTSNGLWGSTPTKYISVRWLHSKDNGRIHNQPDGWYYYKSFKRIGKYNENNSEWMF